LKNITTLVFFGFIFLSCQNAPNGATNPTGSELTDPSIPPKVEFVWVDSPRPYYYYRLSNNISENKNDPPPPGYIPGRLLVRFNKLMVSYTVLKNVTLSPEDDGYANIDYHGAYSIDGQTFEWPVYNTFKVATKYKIKISGDAEDVNGRKLLGEYQKELIPEPVLRYISSYPADGDTSATSLEVFSIFFNSPIGVNTLPSSVTIKPSVDGFWGPSLYSWHLYFTPTSGFKSNTWYEFLFSQSLKDTMNNYLPDPIKVKFKTPAFMVTSTSPMNGAQDVNRMDDLYCFFSYSVDTSSVRSSLSITPTTLGIFYFFGSGFSYSPSNNLLPNTTYTITLSANLKAKNGDVLGTPFTSQFKTGSDL
jgi:hypothetical protein